MRHTISELYSKLTVKGILLYSENYNAGIVAFDQEFHLGIKDWQFTQGVTTPDMITVFHVLLVK